MNFSGTLKVYEDKHRLKQRKCVVIGEGIRVDEVPPASVKQERKQFTTNSEQ